MKVTKAVPVFQPVTIVLETQQEVNQMKQICYNTYEDSLALIGIVLAKKLTEALNAN